MLSCQPVVPTVLSTPALFRVTPRTVAMLKGQFTHILQLFVLQ